MASRPKAPKAFASEVELCSAFIAALPKGWTPYAESCGWDILLVRDADGLQIGIEAKMRLNADVITQAMETDCASAYGRAGPDCRAVLVPESTAGFGAIAKVLGITILTLQRSHAYSDQRRVIYPWLPCERDPHARSWVWERDWFDLCPIERHKLPEYVPDVAAGASAPVQLTNWKIKAIKVCILLRRRGLVTRADFKHLQLDYRRWVAAGWLAGGQGGLVIGPYAPPFLEQHPDVAKKIGADFDRWKPPEQVALPVQGAML